MFVIRHASPKSKPSSSKSTPALKGPPRLGAVIRYTASRLWIEENWDTFSFQNPGLDQARLHSKMLQHWRHHVSADEKEPYKKREKEIMEVKVANRKEKKRFRRKGESPYTLWMKDNREDVRREYPKLAQEELAKILEERWTGASEEQKMVYVKKYEKIEAGFRQSLQPVPYKMRPIEKLTSEALESASDSESLRIQKYQHPNAPVASPSAFQESQQFLYPPESPATILKRPRPNSKDLDTPVMGEQSRNCQNRNSQFEIPAQNNQNPKGIIEERIMDAIPSFEDNFEGHQYANLTSANPFYSNLNPAPEPDCRVFTNLDSRFYYFGDPNKESEEYEPPRKLGRLEYSNQGSIGQDGYASNYSNPEYYLSGNRQTIEGLSHHNYGDIVQYQNSMSNPPPTTSFNHSPHQSLGFNPTVQYENPGNQELPFNVAYFGT